MTDPRGGPIAGAPNWGAGYMPARYQGTLFRSGESPLLDLTTPVGVSPQTQRQSLDLLHLSPGQTLAVTGAAGAYGGYVVQLAKAEGLTVIADASEADHALVASLGTDIVVRRGDDVATRILAHFPNGVDGLADGAVLNERVIPAVRDGGAFTSVRGFTGVPQRGITFTVTSVRTYDGEFEKLDRLRQLVESGAITLRVADTYPPERAGEAHRRLEAGGTRGRLVIAF